MNTFDYRFNGIARDAMRDVEKHTCADCGGRGTYEFISSDEDGNEDLSTGICTSCINGFTI